MATQDVHLDMGAMYRRWAYMVVAICSSLMLFTHPIFNFQEDKGIIYIRSFSMDQQNFYVTQTALSDGQKEITAVMSVKGLYYCNKLMLWSCILCLVCFINTWRALLAFITACIAGSYYVIVIYYASRISDLHYATLSPNWMMIWPAIVFQMMMLTRQNIFRSMVDEAEAAISAIP